MTVDPLIDAVATPVALDDTLNVPPLVFLLTVKVLVLVDALYVNVPLVALRVKVLAPLAIVTATVLLDAL